MALANAEAILLLVVFYFMFGICLANFNYTWGPGNWNKTNCPYGNNHPNATQTSNKFIVGGSENWHYGFDYMDWARKNGPFFVNDTLVFKYDPPNPNGGFPHSVYLLPNYWSFIKCDFRRAKRIANPNQGAGEGFEFVLKKKQPYYFACGEHEGIHCNNGTMKFVVMPLKRWPF
uniref:Phytocyanin domain-containing protein n=1 Tax=Nicotiana tabacum TaxID=4097 RepID=A0A1S4A9T7_TOBAC|nr:uncharacterized protein LOC104090187 [Nicotiana tomentosiformis]XP_016473341.1 PREDICTED: uncharacterized protein LOC107795258 [Nicotiana tabacum]